ncbi:GGDEF domain-containing protein [Butyrivibrio sp. YAB3001]|uniref:GGDEF domain-containing protein n=1 Tax=Butyrivibrio sp. YAB3001 TaxID=1520812 RepID=UPI0008F62E0C|nr:GGDEF domain-containing protein [Butyrivibrio sp. YAB3001]SFC20047.1 diguanylate cyclase (GGDEF) domain-containing protein [Butyrivibrio sp. YAB3001]
MNKRFILPALTALAILAAIVVFCLLLVSHTQTDPMITLDSDWRTTINGTPYELIALKKLYHTYTSSLARGDHIVLSTTLPDIGDIPNPTILFRTRYTTLEVYIDQELIFEYGKDFYNANKFLGKMYHEIALPSRYAGRTLTFVMDVGENRAFSGLEPPILGSQADISGTFLHHSILILTTGITTFVFGFTFLCIALIFVSSVPEVISLLFGALSCMNLGVWLLTYYNFFSFLVYTDYETQIEYFTLYLIVPYCYVILYYLEDLQNDKLFKAIMYVSWGVPLAQYALHYLFNIHMYVTLPLYEISAVFGFGILLFFAYRTSKKKNVRTSSIVQLTGLLVFSVSVMTHLVLNLLGPIMYSYNTIFGRIVIAIGSIYYVLCHLSTYLIFITESYAKKQENISLSHLAYADGLTNLANRAKADSLMEELNNASDDYCILSIDLNGLKTVNDKFGHPTGDRYIKDFAKVLTNTFSDECFCARIGGDEFLVVMRDAATKDINALIDRMNSALNVMNALYTEYHRSVSTGFAFRHECKDGNSHKVYLLADQRMYERKRLMHEELGIKARF